MRLLGLQQQNVDKKILELCARACQAGASGHVAARGQFDGEPAERLGPSPRGDANAPHSARSLLFPIVEFLERLAQQRGVHLILGPLPLLGE
jgi:hypothetical protein